MLAQGINQDQKTAINKVDSKTLVRPVLICDEKGGLETQATPLITS